MKGQTITPGRQSSRKITISLPAELLAYADAQARQRQTSRSQYIAQALADLRAAEARCLAAEGYRFYAEEVEAFAAESAPATAEALEHGGPGAQL